MAENEKESKNNDNTIGNYNYKEVEEGVLKFWKDSGIYSKSVKRNKGNKKFFFIQGPPYTSGAIHIGHAWNNSLKDIVLRHRRMKGQDVFDRAAYDMHGLPTERKVMAEHNFKYKHEILEYGLEKFNKECKEYATDKALKMNEDLKRVGIWMDFDNARLPVDNSYIEGVWFLIKQAHKNGRLYEGLRTMSWCADCATAMAKHECEYKTLDEESVFVKFPVKGKENEYLIIWTTTPWTICYNLAIMVHPELDYVRAKVDDEVWILAKGLSAPVVQSVANKELNILDEFPGKDLEGLEYEHPWTSEIKQLAEIKQKHPKTHTVLLSDEYVSLSAGSGLVHCAPGCGPEDYEVGHVNNIPPFNNLSESGVFPEDMGKFAGFIAKADDKKFIEEMKQSDILIAVTPVEHEYAHCERCRNPVIFRTTKQWFFKIEDLKERMVEGNEKIHWVPEAGKNAFRSWLENLRDNSITKQRFWGTPVPIWKCEKCGEYDVIGSADELNAKAGHVPDDLHKPWIDEVEISCDCGGMKKRCPDILDVWIDAGTLSWNILDFPKNKDMYESLWPADFILEAKEQVRGWFNMLMVTSIMALDDNFPFKACYMHGMLTDVEGVKMSKSLGNVISPYELIDKHGADALRYYMCETTAGEDINFSWDEAKLRQRYLTVFWNMHKYLVQLCRQHSVTPTDDVSKFKDNLGTEEKYILSRLNSTLKTLNEYLDSYRIDESIPELTKFMLELSRTYIQLTRDKSSSSDEVERNTVINTLYTCLIRLIELQAPVTPFVCEAMYQNFKTEFNLEEESVHHRTWPGFDESMINTGLEQKMDFAQGLIQSILAAREKIQIGVRWPLKQVIFTPKNPDYGAYATEMAELIKSQTNVKVINLQDSVEGVTRSVKPDFKKLAPEFGAEGIAKIIAHLSTTSAETILNRIEKEGKYVVIVDDNTYEIKKDHLLVTTTAPDHLHMTSSKHGDIFADKTRNKELDSEGFSRELTRRIQMMRKNSGLSKENTIELFVKVDAEMSDMLAPWTDQVKDKVGAESIILGVEDLPDCETKSEEKVKGKIFNVAFNKK
ncbi:isoleucine--tRNA ligase [Candidatus Woesearchaeota archaeon]|jgi:isoleucyl-tRNA synthetase|nr:isoleucine--tRNA ligase [Candidatus Woesearchaeota archaeon]MBT3537665.1 isoleucine--tRNA ligase [Candidatus Woesearchaeota archaeon]MBT4717021.1 isoleucine--tRNA ligase [Candidatus Woesearchaeota archaeon]MBT7105334.1 isoleucine--tRNA ligase [Candidatus Woesearchaeota archaeon]MBT7931525.1 isoleucine--tRNA ligase [Candidatus Woesearchaeota archaeon]